MLTHKGTSSSPAAGQAGADRQIGPPPSHRTCLLGTAHPRACCLHRGASTSKPRRRGGAPEIAVNLVTFKSHFSCTSVANVVCAFFFFFSCYAVKAGGSEGNGTALIPGTQSISTQRISQNTLCLSPAPTRSNFPGSCRPRRQLGSLPAPLGPPGIHPARGGRPGRLAGNTAHFPLNPSSVPGPGVY